MGLITEVDILDEAKECFLTYSAEVLTDRAIPAAEDGLLSAQRKIIWTMEDHLKMDSTGKTKKCQAIVGSTLMTSYFHGDQACYGVLTKMSQKFLMRYPLLEGQGSLGSQESNDLVASSRYTEAKPSVYADLMMENFNKHPVPLKETYNGEYMEPVVLPGLFPNALCNGRTSIGISMAHSSAPNNLTEVCDGIIAYIKNNDITIDELMKYIKGPDFPLGGTVINTDEIKAAYATGRSTKSLKIQGDYEIDGDKIIFTSIPYRTYRDKIKEQLRNNVDAFENVLSDFDDESGVGSNRLVFYLKKGASAQSLLQKLFQYTDLQTTFSYNMNFIVDGTPKLCSLKTLIQSYVAHQNNVLVNVATVDKAAAQKRAHVLEGFLIIIKDIETAINLIKTSSDKPEARKRLIDHFKIDDEQAKAILELQLGRLTRLDQSDLLKELETKKAIVAENDKIINNSEYRSIKLIDLIAKMRDKYGDKRRTKLVNLPALDKEEKQIAAIEPEKCVVIMTEAGNIKRIPATAFKTQRRNTKGVKTQDDITSAIIRTNTVDNLMVFTDKGKTYRLLVDSIPEGTNTSKGASIRSLISLEPSENPTVIYSMYRDNSAKYVLFVTKNGIVKKTDIAEYNSTKRKNGIGAITLKENDELAAVTLINNEELFLITHNGYVLRFNSSEIVATSRMTMGVKGITLGADDFVVAALPIRTQTDNLALFSTIGHGKQIILSEIPILKRGSKGLQGVKNESIAAAQLVNKDDNVLLIGASNSICISAQEIPVLSRAATGNTMLKTIISASKV